MRYGLKLLTAIGFCSVCAFAPVTAQAAWWQSARPVAAPPPPLLTQDMAQWKTLAGAYTTATDPVAGSLVVGVAGPPVRFESLNALSGDCELRAQVRLRTDISPYAGATLVLGRKDDAHPGVQVRLVGRRGSGVAECSVERGDGKPLFDVKALAATLPWVPQVPTTFNYSPQAYTQFLPGWPPQFRASVENAMSTLPGREDKFLQVRLQLSRGRLRAYIDDRLIATRDDADFDPAGTARIELYPGTALAGYSIVPLALPAAAAADFVTLPLGGYANGRSFIDGAAVEPATLPPAGQTVQVQGVPFVFPGVNSEGNDHLDISKSLFRQGNASDYMSTNGFRWGGAALRDPARIQLRFANGQFDTLYLIAASTGQADTLPLVTAQFFRTGAGFPERFVSRVPIATATEKGATPLGVKLVNGRKVKLWLVKMALDPGKLSAFADLSILEMELTKKVYLFRTWPDPYSYDYYQGGRPSGVHVFAVTLGRVPTAFSFEPTRFGHVWTAPAVPGYTADLVNNTRRAQKGTLLVTTRSYDGTETSSRRLPVALAPHASRRLEIAEPCKLNGYHDITATLQVAGRSWTEKRSFVRLAPDRRAPKWQEGKGALFGYWGFPGGHHTPNADIARTLMVDAGARVSIIGSVPSPEEPAFAHWASLPTGAWAVAPQAWAAEQPVDPAKRAAYKLQVVKSIEDSWSKIPAELRPDFVAFFPEPNISLRLTTGNYPSYWGEPDYQWSPYEKDRVRMFRVTAEIAGEAVREKWPKLKIMIPWGDPLFVIPLLRDGLTSKSIDGSAIDIPGFERMPETQLHQLTNNRLYVLRHEYQKAGIANPLFYYTEGICVPTHQGALTWREQMDTYNRWSLLSMAYGVTRFYSGWNAFDLASYYGAEHYGAVGIQRRIPYCDPKPAYAAYATMTALLDQANYDGWLPTGSLSTYCLRFRGPHGLVYALWTLRGKRPVALSVAHGNAVQVTDAMGNAHTATGFAGRVQIETTPSVVYVTAADITAAAVGAPDNSDSTVTTGAVPIADLGDGSWHYSDLRDEGYETSNFAIQRYQGHFSSEIANDAVHGRVLRSTLLKQDKVHQLMPWYRALTPAKPLLLPGAPAHLGLWVKGNSDWGRVVYVVHDADGEKWISVGQKDDWNNDDTHSWSSFNFDGWRYLRFELPGHLGYDNFRKYGTTWWGTYGGGSAAERGIINLPLTLDTIMVEQRSHVIYVNDVQPAAGSQVELSKLYLEYDDPQDSGAEAVRRSRLRMPLPPAPSNLPNPIARMQADGVGAPTRLTALKPPEHEYDGTRVNVFFDEVAGAKRYFLWVGAHQDGSSAVNLTPNGLKNGDLVTGLRPALPLYYWVVYEDATGKLSKPSAVHSEVLVDAFGQK